MATRGFPADRVLGHPMYIDPLYRPYHTDYSKSPYRSPNPIPPKYPLVDPARQHLGWGNAFRSQHEGYCPPGWYMDKHNYCIPEEPESWGTFYKKESQTKIPYKGANGDRAYNRELWCSDDDVAIANGWNEKGRAKISKTCCANFW